MTLFLSRKAWQSSHIAARQVPTTMKKNNTLAELARLIRYYILKSTTAAGSGHPTSSLSATDIMTTLRLGGFFRADLEYPEYINNDRLIFSKGHAAPLLYSLYAAAGKVTEEELVTLRQFGSRLEGHPTMRFPYTEAATGSLGQGLSIGVGMALNAKLDKLNYKTFVLLGDGEMAEGSNWEAIHVAAHYKLNNLIGVLDVSGLEQAGDSMDWHSKKDHGALDHAVRLKAFGWETIVIDGHNLTAIASAFKKATTAARRGPAFGGKNKPMMIIAKTIKGKGVKFLEGKNHWHGKALAVAELEKALKGMGRVDTVISGEVSKPAVKMLNAKLPMSNQVQSSNVQYVVGDTFAPRKAYGNALVRLGASNPNVIAMDAGVSNSTYADMFKKVYPKRYFEMYIAEQNMVGAGFGLAQRGKIPFVSTFAAFFTRAFDQIRLSDLSNANIKFCGGHCGVSIGPDGGSQMGLEDIGMFRSVQNCAVLYPSDAVSMEKLVFAAAEHKGNVYLRSTRAELPVLYSANEEFEIGGSKTLRSSPSDVATVIGCGVTLHEALKAYELLKKENIVIRVVDLYSIKPIDTETLEKAVRETKNIITVEDHYAEGGMGEAVAVAISDLRVERLCVRKMPRSGKPEELLRFEEIDAEAIVKKVKGFIR